MTATVVQWELCGTNFRENIANLWVSCYNGNNDRSARVLFVQHPREQGEWLRQSPRYARVLTASFALLPRVMDEQHPRNPVIIPRENHRVQIFNHRKPHFFLPNPRWPPTGKWKCHISGAHDPISTMLVSILWFSMCLNWLNWFWKWLDVKVIVKRSFSRSNMIKHLHGKLSGN